jgi:putative membrane protein
MKKANHVLTFFKGVAMGAADVIPGVSGGTIAFITGIYERFINSIKSINYKNIKLLLKGKFKEFWKNIDGTFLSVLLCGIAASFLSLARLMTFLITTYPIIVWAFFSGLIIASTIFIARDVRWNIKSIAAFLIFTVAAFLITSPENAPLHASHENWYIFICGAIAICAMILPGISGSFILVLLGEYFFMMKALSEFNFLVIGIFLCGAAVGIITFSRVLSWLFKHYKIITLASLTGFMFGSLNKIWPWKQTLSTFIDSHGITQPLAQKNIFPSTYETTNGNPKLALAILFALTGFVLIFAIEFISKLYANRRQHNETEI